MYVYTYLGVDLHGEEEAEVGVGGERVELLLQLHQPLRSQVNVLQQHPTVEEHTHKWCLERERDMTCERRVFVCERGRERE